MDQPPVVRQNFRKTLNFFNVPCYLAPLYGIHFKCLFNFGEGQVGA
jgi:hypothetical protein